MYFNHNEKIHLFLKAFLSGLIPPMVLLLTCVLNGNKSELEVGNANRYQPCSCADCIWFVNGETFKKSY